MLFSNAKISESVGVLGRQLYFADRLHEHCGYLFGICIKGAVCRKYWIDLSFCNSQRIVRRFSWFFNWFIRPYLAEHVPLFHSINPASLICDLFYCLNMDGNYQRYLVKLGTILGMSVLCTMIGFLLTRRRKYASL